MYKSNKFHRGNSCKVMIYTDGQKSSHKRKNTRRQANKAVRRYKGDIANGSTFKKIYETYDICDFKIDLRFKQNPSQYARAVYNHHGVNYTNK